jgi:hypothetical protein
VFFKYVDQSATKNEIRDALLWNASENGGELSQSRANNLADKFKKGQFDPDLARYIQYSDPTGELATRNVDAERTLVAA